MSNDARTAPIDATATSALAANGLRFALLRAEDDTFEPWFQGMTRGFYAPRNTESDVAERVKGISHRRLSGVWDDTLVDAGTPVGTASSWITELSVPGKRAIPSWAISTITVAQTHRRRGIARNMIQAELRTAAALSVPVAILTVSEATIYGRFGFAPSALAADYKIDTKRAKWNGPVPTGRVQLVTSETAREGGAWAAVEAARLQTPGQIYFDGHLWERMFGLPGRGDPKEFRVARYDDEDGAQQGVVIYKAVDSDEKLSISVQYLAAASDDAYAALWRYLLEMDLVSEVTAALRRVDEPLKWQVTDPRAVHEENVGDHLWVRILDVKAALEARTYAAPAILTLDVSDELGFAGGGYRVEIDATGEAAVTPVPEPVEGADLTLTIADLSAIYLGGVSVNTLVRAGRVKAKTPAAATAADAAFRSEVTPWLSIWF